MPSLAQTLLFTYVVVTLVIGFVSTYRPKPDFGIIFGWPILAVAGIVWLVIAIAVLVLGVVFETLRSVCRHIGTMFGQNWFPEKESETNHRGLDGNVAGGPPTMF